MQVGDEHALDPVEAEPEPAQPVLEQQPVLVGIEAGIQQVDRSVVRRDRVAERVRIPGFGIAVGIDQMPSATWSGAVIRSDWESRNCDGTVGCTGPSSPMEAGPVLPPARLQRPGLARDALV
ncbi:hypothetical protein GCM10025866_20740 [Naasia aerilata]|uniref:Uncharacterized protein n=1 Tax=Naasia aerilata TaxID=1162966 RepID=A0ABN6XMF0_9MICO|nr:hypothetical protein GCM10025866_20740 [Naasia aerilata]